MIKGLRISVLQDKSCKGDNCSNNGLSNRFDELTLIGTSKFPVSGHLELDDSRPAVCLDLNAADELIVVPAHVDENGRVTPFKPSGKIRQFGGQAVSTSDSRFGEAIERATGRRLYAPLFLHDRFE